jgi:hypothetical protein
MLCWLLLCTVLFPVLQCAVYTMFCAECSSVQFCLCTIHYAARIMFYDGCFSVHDCPLSCVRVLNDQVCFIVLSSVLKSTACAMSCAGCSTVQNCPLYYCLMPASCHVLDVLVCSTAPVLYSVLTVLCSMLDVLVYNAAPFALSCAGCSTVQNCPLYYSLMPASCHMLDVLVCSTAPVLSSVLPVLCSMLDVLVYSAAPFAMSSAWML